MSFFSSFTTPVVIVRPFNTYGPRQSARAVIPTIITQLLNGNRRIKLGSIHPTRDFSYIEDTVRGFIAVAETESSIGEVINLGSNFEITIGDTAKLIADLMGVEIDIETDPQRIRPEKSEVERLWADNTKANLLAGWKPRFGGLAGLREGLQKTITWFSHSENLNRYKAELYNL